jgi:hypothetical protein
MIHEGVYKHACGECGSLKRTDQALRLHVTALHSGTAKSYKKKEETRISHLLLEHGFAFDANTCVDFCQDADKKQRAYIDFAIQTTDGRSIIILEVDEHSRSLGNLKTEAEVGGRPIRCDDGTDAWRYSVTCEQRRMLEIVAAMRKAGEERPITFLRYNCHNFKIDGQRYLLDQEAREAMLVDFINSWETHQEFSIVCAFYDAYHLFYRAPRTGRISLARVFPCDWHVSCYKHDEFV